MKIVKTGWWLALILLIGGCSSMQIAKSGQNPPRLAPRSAIAVAPFHNYTATPMAGYSAASIAKVILEKHGYPAAELAMQPKDDDITDARQLSTQAKIAKAKAAGYRYLLDGKVTEWRYKTGIDAEPVAGLVVDLIDTETGKHLYSGSGSKEALSGSALTLTAQQLLDRLLP